MKGIVLILGILSLFFSSCSPLKSSPKEEKHQMELTLHEIQTNLDDLRHDFNCFQTELTIVDGKIKHHENALTSLKEQQLEKQQNTIEQLLEKLTHLEKKMRILEKAYEEGASDIHKLASHSEEIISALTQYKERIGELEKEILSQNRKFDELAKLKTTIERVAKSLKENSATYGQVKIYRVRAGDSLEKIARNYDSNVEELKRLNQLEQDLIVVGQELKVPAN